MAETMAVAGLDVHAWLTHGAAVHVPSGELVQIRFGRRGRAGAVAARLPAPVRACYEAGPTGFGLYRALLGRA